MHRLLILVLPLAFLMLAPPSNAAGTLTAQQIFDKMIHYESDQLAKTPGITDYRCNITETSIQQGSHSREVTEKTLYFMTPVFQLQMVGDEPVFYFDQDLMIILLESVTLTRERDAEVNGIPCYVITTRPVDRAFAAYSRTYYVAQDDFRHVRTISHHANERYDNLTTQIEYTYGQVDKYTLLVRTDAVTTNADGVELARTSAEYTDYEFGIGLDLQFFVERVGNRTPNVPLN